MIKDVESERLGDLLCTAFALSCVNLKAIHLERGEVLLDFVQPKYCYSNTLNLSAGVRLSSSASRTSPSQRHSRAKVCSSQPEVKLLGMRGSRQMPRSTDVVSSQDVREAPRIERRDVTTRAKVKPRGGIASTSNVNEKVSPAGMSEQ
ncbi:hypothetical protein DVH05_005988 [Phytophthora capsici]|nr:hypothetical protein DVH05_005988 [Phytophthora capsici]